MAPRWLQSLIRLFQPRRRRRRFDTPFPVAWLPYVEALPFYGTLTPTEQERLRHILRVLAEEKRWEGCGGLAITDEVKVTIAAQAALLVLNFDDDYYPGVQTILVYPSAFIVDYDADGHPDVHLGEAWDDGPVVLAWDSAAHGAADHRDGINVVLHEFAHKLDQVDDLSDGTPALRDREAYVRWKEVMTQEYERLIRNDEAGHATLLDPYGAGNPAEFFAVATECFFEEARQLRREHPALYELFRDYYRQDPATRRR